MNIHVEAINLLKNVARDIRIDVTDARIKFDEDNNACISLLHKDTVNIFKRVCFYIVQSRAMSMFRYCHNTDITYKVLLIKESGD